MNANAEKQQYEQKACKNASISLNKSAEPLSDYLSVQKQRLLLSHDVFCRIGVISEAQRTLLFTNTQRCRSTRSRHILEDDTRSQTSQ